MMPLRRQQPEDRKSLRHVWLTFVCCSGSQTLRSPGAGLLSSAYSPWWRTQESVLVVLGLSLGPVNCAVRVFRRCVDGVELEHLSV